MFDSNMIHSRPLFAAALRWNGRSGYSYIFEQSAADERAKEQRRYYISGPLPSLSLRAVEASTSATARGAQGNF